MISKELQESCKNRFNGTNRIIFLAEDSQERRNALSKALPTFNILSEDVAIGPNNNVWRIVPLTSNMLMKPIVEAIIDCKIDENTFRNIVLPACEIRCIRMEFFE